MPDTTPAQVPDTIPFKPVGSQTAGPNEVTAERINDQTNKRPNEATAEPQSPREERLAKWGRFQRGRGRFRDRRNRFHNDQMQGQADGQAQSPENGEAPQEERPQLPPLKLWELEGMSLEALNEKLEGFFTPEELAGTYRKHDVINDFIRAYMRRGGTVITNGVIEIMSDGFGFLRSEKSSYLACPEDVYVAPNYVRRFNLRTGDFVEGPIRDPRERPERGKEKFLALGRIETVNGRPPAEWRRIIPFENLTPIFPTRRIQLERIAPGAGPTDISMRFVDLFAPIGFGQRGLIVAPPRTGKTVLLQKVANAITANYPDAYLIVLLIDERPEEVTDMERNTKAHVLSSTFDEAPERHAQVSEMAIEMAKRKVESGSDVVILLDSITRLARAYNTLAPHSGKILSGGVDANAMFKPKRFFGAARNIEGGGSLTIIATALIETGSRMDEVIFEEFKGTGNMELVLDRQLSDRRIFPAINVGLSGTRKEELIVSPPELNLARNLRKMLTDSPTPLDSMDNIIKHMKKFNSNLDLMMQKFNS
jgi:transcription termination factor Rho